MSDCTFRPAVPGDEELILTFIRALAEYERMADQVVATPALLREWVFEKGKAEVIFALADGKEVGFALFFSKISGNPHFLLGRRLLGVKCRYLFKGEEKSAYVFKFIFKGVVNRTKYHF